MMLLLLLMMTICLKFNDKFCIRLLSESANHARVSISNDKTQKILLRFYFIWMRWPLKMMWEMSNLESFLQERRKTTKNSRRWKEKKLSAKHSFSFTANLFNAFISHRFSLYRVSAEEAKNETKRNQIQFNRWAYNIQVKWQLDWLAFLREKLFLSI